MLKKEKKYIINKCNEILEIAKFTSASNKNKDYKDILNTDLKIKDIYIFQAGERDDFTKDFNNFLKLLNELITELNIYCYNEFIGYIKGISQTIKILDCDGE